MMKKIITLTLIIIMFLTCLVGCDEDTSQTPMENVKSDIKIETEPNKTTEYNAIEKTADEIIKAFNAKIKSDNSTLSKEDIDSLTFSYYRQEDIPQYNAVSYEYVNPYEIMDICLFEYVDTNEVFYGAIEIKKSFFDTNRNTALPGFKYMCSCFANVFDSRITEDKFEDIWTTVWYNNDIYSYYELEYKLVKGSDYLTFAINYCGESNKTGTEVKTKSNVADKSKTTDTDIKIKSNVAAEFKNFDTDVETKSNVIDKSKTPDTNNDTAKNNEPIYYPFLKEEGQSLSFDLTIEQFVTNYNRVKSTYGKEYVDIEKSDFVFMDSHEWFSGEETEVYGCPITILGHNNGILIMLEIDKNTQKIKGAMLGIEDYESNEKYEDMFELQYRILTKAVGLSDDESAELLNEMSYNEKYLANPTVYSKGLALLYSTSDDCAYYMITCLTNELVQTLSVFEDVI